MVRITVGRKDIDFLGNTRAECSVLMQPMASLSSKTIDIIGTTEISEKQVFLPTTNLFVGDLLSKLRATITLTDKGSLQLKLPWQRLSWLSQSREEEWRLLLTEKGQ
ncbi:hypothetical protein AAY473_002012 [Plecturocebus cupreus]